MKSDDFINEGSSYHDKSQDYSKVQSRKSHSGVDYSAMSKDEQDAYDKDKQRWVDQREQNKMYEGEPVSSPKIDSIESVKEHHPEIYKFFQQIGAWMTFDNYGKVESYHTGGQKFIVITLQPSAGLGNTKAVMDGEGINYSENEYGIEGSIGDMHWTARDDDYKGQRGNIAEVWNFAMPHKDNATATSSDRTMEGESPITNSEAEEQVEIALGNIITNTRGYFPNDTYGTVNYINKKMNNLNDRQYNGLIQEPMLQAEVMKGGITSHTLMQALNLK